MQGGKKIRVNFFPTKKKKEEKKMSIDKCVVFVTYVLYLKREIYIKMHLFLKKRVYF